MIDFGIINRLSLEISFFQRYETYFLKFCNILQHFNLLNKVLVVVWKIKGKAFDGYLARSSQEKKNYVEREKKINVNLDIFHP